MIMSGILSFLIYAASVCLHLGVVDAAVPLNITVCYRDLMDNPIPMDTKSLVALIRKVEHLPGGATLDLRSMVYTLLHKFRIDGVVRDPYMSTTANVTAIKQDEVQSSKWRVLMEKLLPGNANMFPEGSLTQAEQCALHVMMSASIDINDCPRKASTDYPNDGCREKGVVYHSSGAVDAGAVLAAITASSQPQTVRLEKLIQKPKDDERLLEMYRKYASMGNDAAVDSQWAATLAGDLAEVALFQGPIVTSGMNMGPGGKWDDDLFFRNYTIDIDYTSHWELTDAEIRGGIDGLVLASKLQEWTKQTSRLRLSQLLEMYYSPRGMSFDSSFRACDRQEKASGIITKDRLQAETVNMARVLYMSSAPTVTLMDTKLQEFGMKAVDSFQTYMPQVVGKSREIDCEPNSPTPLVEVYAVLDSTWTQKDAARLLVYLAEQIDVGEFSSSLNVLHGRGDTWLVRKAVRTTDVPQQVLNQTDSSIWSSRLDLPKALQTVNSLLGEDDSTTNSSVLPDVTVEGGPGLVVLLLLPTATVNDPELQLVQEQVKLLRQIRPDATLIAVTSDSNKVRFYKMLDSDSVVVSPIEDSISSLVSAAKNSLLAVPLRLVPRSCNQQDYNKGSMEHYLTPQVPFKFRIHPTNMVEATALSVSVHSYDTGIVSVCLTAPDVTATVDDCQELTGVAEAAFNKTVQCRSASTCNPLELMITATNSKHKCAEDDCRYPDQVRVGIQASIVCGNGVSGSGIANFLVMLLPTLLLTKLLS